MRAKYFARKYITSDDDACYMPVFRVGVQEFYISNTAFDTEEEALFICDMHKKAIEQLEKPLESEETRGLGE